MRIIKFILVGYMKKQMCNRLLFILMKLIYILIIKIMVVFVYLTNIFYLLAAGEFKLASIYAFQTIKSGSMVST